MKILAWLQEEGSARVRDLSAAFAVSEATIRQDLEKLEADHTVVHHVSRATAHLWLVTPLQNNGDDRHAKLNKMFDSHPPLNERIAILRKLEGLDPNGRGPVDDTVTGVPVDLATLSHSAQRRTGLDPVLTGGLAVNTPTEPSSATGDSAPMVIPKPGASPPGWFRRDANTLRYWNGNVFTEWTATWDGKRWVQSKTPATQ